MTIAGGQEDFIFTEESVHGDGGNFNSTKFRFGVNQKLTNPNFTMNWRKVYGGDLKPQKMVVGEKGYQFTLEWVVDKWNFLKYISNLSTETGTDPYTHTFTIPKEDFSGSSFAFQRKFSSTLAYLFKGVKMTSMTITFQKGTDETGYLRISAPCICQDIEKVNTVDIETLAESTRDIFIFNTARVTTASNEIVEINSGTYVFDWNVNADDSRYANATLKELIGEPIYTNLTEELSLNINTKNSTFLDEFLARSELTGTNKLEFEYDATNNKVEINFEHLYNNGNLPPTQFGEVTKTDINYVPIINNIVVTDNQANY